MLLPSPPWGRSPSFPPAGSAWRALLAPQGTQLGPRLFPGPQVQVVSPQGQPVPIPGGWRPSRPLWQRDQGAHCEPARVQGCLWVPGSPRDLGSVCVPGVCLWPIGLGSAFCSCSCVGFSGSSSMGTELRTVPAHSSVGLSAPASSQRGGCHRVGVRRSKGNPVLIRCLAAAPGSHQSAACPWVCLFWVLHIHGVAHVVHGWPLPERRVLSSVL